MTEVDEPLEVHPLVQLAKRAVEVYVRERRVIDPPAELIPEMRERAGVFVSLKKAAQLRGCIGTFMPTMPTVAEEVIQNAISSATRDPRFPQVKASELGELVCGVDVLTDPKLVEDVSQLDPKRHGVIVRCGPRRGLLLPDLDGVDTVEQQIDIACRKAGISLKEKIELHCFEVKRYK